MSAAGPIAIVDLPWMPIFLFICFLIHPWLGMLSLAGAVVLVALTILTERASRDPARTVARDAGLLGRRANRNGVLVHDPRRFITRCELRSARLVSRCRLLG